jgi:mannose-6-phosphate isomerase-like protein (cupin superfamily)
MQLEGGVQVTGLKDGQPRREGALRVWDHFRGDKVSLRVLELESGERAELRNEHEEEVLYDLTRDTAIHLPAGNTFTIDGPMTLLSVRTPAISTARETLVVTLEERPLQRTGDRWYRELIQSEVTQFVGVIPPGRAPDHYHLYEEVLCILDGEGAMWAGPSSTPIQRGSCIYLPPRQMHCVENRSSRDLRLLGVFFPSGSPAVRYR